MIWMSSSGRSPGNARVSRARRQTCLRFRSAPRDAATHTGNVHSAHEGVGAAWPRGGGKMWRAGHAVCFARSSRGATDTDCCIRGSANACAPCPPHIVERWQSVYEVAGCGRRCPPPFPRAEQVPLLGCDMAAVNLKVSRVRQSGKTVHSPVTQGCTKRARHIGHTGALRQDPSQHPPSSTRAPQTPPTHSPHVEQFFGRASRLLTPPASSVKRVKLTIAAPAKEPALSAPGSSPCHIRQAGAC